MNGLELNQQTVKYLQQNIQNTGTSLESGALAGWAVYEYFKDLSIITKTKAAVSEAEIWSDKTAKDAQHYAKRSWIPLNASLYGDGAYDDPALAQCHRLNPDPLMRTSNKHIEKKEFTLETLAFLMGMHTLGVACIVTYFSRK